MFDPWQAKILKGLGISGFQRVAYGRQRTAKVGLPSADIFMDNTMYSHTRLQTI